LKSRSVLRGVGPKPEASSDSKGDAAQVQRDGRYFKFRKMTAAGCCVEHTTRTRYERLVRDCVAAPSGVGRALAILTGIVHAACTLGRGCTTDGLKAAEMLAKNVWLE